MGAIAVRLPNIVYASQSGIVLNGTTDQTTQVQAILDRFGSAGTPLQFVIDGDIALNTIYVWGGQRVSSIPGCVIQKLPYPYSNGLPLITNKHWVLGTVTPGGTDANITIDNLYLDGNRRNGGSGVAFPNGTKPYLNASNDVIYTIGIYGASNVFIQNVTVFDSPAGGLHLANVHHCMINNFSKFLNAGDTYGGDAVIQMQGYCYDINGVGIRGTCNADPLAFNANDGNDEVSPVITYITGTVVQGPIQYCSFRDIHVEGFPGCIGLVRFLSSNTSSFIQNITIEKASVVATATTAISFIHFDNFSLPLGNGAYDNITIRDVHIETNQMTSGNAVVWFGTATVNNVVLDNIQVCATAALAIPIIDVSSGTTIQSLRVNNLQVEDASGNISGAPLVLLAGTVTHGVVSNTRINRGTTLLAQAAINCTGTINALQVIGGKYDYVNYVVLVTGGTTTLVQAIGVLHTNTSDDSFAQTGGTFTTLVYTGCNVATGISSGTIGTVTHG